MSPAISVALVGVFTNKQLGTALVGVSPTSNWAQPLLVFFTNKQLSTALVGVFTNKQLGTALVGVFTNKQLSTALVALVGVFTNKTNVYLRNATCHRFYIKH
jgi:hypothetical protein